MNLRVSASGKDVFLQNVAPAQLATTNVTFADGSRLLFGDNTPAQTADNGNNSLAGTAGDDHLWGFGGRDGLNGGAGNDWLAGGTGIDTVTGGAGADSFVFREAASNSNFDRVSDFVSGADRLMFHQDFFAGIDTAGSFWAAAGATSGHDADDRIIYNTSTGFLYYDADGSGAGGAQLIATLTGAPTVVAGDIAAFDDETSGSGGSGTPTNGNDTLVGTNGDDTIDGLAGDDSISGLGGDDSLIGGPGADTLDGGAGNDTYRADGQDMLTDASGIDTVIATDGEWTLADGFENLTVTGAPVLFDIALAVGNDLDNVIIIQDIEVGVAWVMGEGGNDTLIGDDDSTEEFIFEGDYGADTVDGRGGESDLLNFQSASSAVILDFRDGTVTGGGTGGSGS